MCNIPSLKCCWGGWCDLEWGLLIACCKNRRIWYSEHSLQCTNCIMCEAIKTTVFIGEMLMKYCRCSVKTDGNYICCYITMLSFSFNRPRFPGLNSGIYLVSKNRYCTTFLRFYSARPPVGVQSIAMSVYVSLCLYVCLSVCPLA